MSSKSIPRHHKKIIFSTSLGTAFEWYDFYLYGTLARILGQQFLPNYNPTTDFIVMLALFVTGFIFRPLGALFFGRLGDMVGRKHTFLVTILIMGMSTFIIGLLPSYREIGIAAPIILIGLRILQGIAIGGEFGGAATYVAEHAPADQRGRYTGWIQITASGGLLLSMIVSTVIRSAMGEEAFMDWGWRLPFLFSIVLLIFSIGLRMQLDESPTFIQLKADGLVSTQPLKDSFSDRANLKKVLMLLFGLCAGQGVIWYTSHVYSWFFLVHNLKLSIPQSHMLMIVALALALPCFVFFATLSDKLGRRPIMIVGCLLAALLYFPMFKALTYVVNPALNQAQERAPVVLFADPERCSFKFHLLHSGTQDVHSCDIAKAYLAQSGIAYRNESAPPGTIAQVWVGSEVISAYEGGQRNSRQESVVFKQRIREALQQAGYPSQASVSGMSQFWVIVILWLILLPAAMTYAPMMGLLVEVFPTRIRYTSISLPYHIGDGWFGSIVSIIAFAIVAVTGNIFSGLWYPVGMALLSGVLACWFQLSKTDEL